MIHDFAEPEDVRMFANNYSNNHFHSIQNYIQMAHISHNKTKAVSVFLSSKISAPDKNG